MSKNELKLANLRKQIETLKHFNYRHRTQINLNEDRLNALRARFRKLLKQSKVTLQPKIKKLKVKACPIPADYECPLPIDVSEIDLTTSNH